MQILGLDTYNLAARNAASRNINVGGRRAISTTDKYNGDNLRMILIRLLRN